MLQIRTGSDSIFSDQDWIQTKIFHSLLISALLSRKREPRDCNVMEKIIFFYHCVSLGKMVTTTILQLSLVAGRDEHGSGLDRTGSGLKPILAGSGLDRTAIFLKIGGSGLDRTEKFFCFNVICLSEHIKNLFVI